MVLVYFALYWLCCRYPWIYINTLRPGQNCRHFANDIYKCIFLNKNVWISLKFSLKFVPKFRITILFQHWFREWIGADQVVNHYLNQWWIVCWHTHASLVLNESIMYPYPSGCLHWSWDSRTPGTEVIAENMQPNTPKRVPRELIYRLFGVNSSWPSDV